MRAIAALSIILLLATACMQNQTDLVNSFVGHSSSELFAQMGAPDLEAPNSDGTARVLTYYGRDGRTQQINCRRNFLVKNGIVVDARHNCPPNWLRGTY